MNGSEKIAFDYLTKLGWQPKEKYKNKSVGMPDFKCSDDEKGMPRYVEVKKYTDSLRLVQLDAISVLIAKKNIVYIAIVIDTGLHSLRKIKLYAEDIVIDKAVEEKIKNRRDDEINTLIEENIKLKKQLNEYTTNMIKLIDDGDRILQLCTMENERRYESLLYDVNRMNQRIDVLFDAILHHYHHSKNHQQIKIDISHQILMPIVTELAEMIKSLDVIKFQLFYKSNPSLISYASYNKLKDNSTTLIRFKERIEQIER